MTAYSRPAVTVDLKNVIGPGFYDSHRAVREQRAHTLVEEGGRGSLKSSFCSVEIVLWLLKWPQSHALVMRQMGNTLEDSVYSQMLWAVAKLGLSEHFLEKKSPLRLIYKPTGQTIYFRGLDDEMKIKGIKPKFGYIGCLWFEEADQLRRGENAVLSVKQSAFRGSGSNPTLTLISFNPPANARNWANRYAREQQPGKLVHHSSYLDAPRDWLGKEFLDGADWLRKTKPLKYRHMYLGEMVGSGTQVFDNILSRKTTAKEIAGFDNIISGVDWGYYPDPWVFIRTYYHAATRTLYIFDEARGNKMQNAVTAEIVKGRVAPGELILADLSDEKACADYRSYGLRCWPARKGPGSRELGVRWLQGLNAIVIDPVKCPCVLQEFLEWEYEVAPDGTVLGTLMDANDHGIDAARYACSRIWQRKGA